MTRNIVRSSKNPEDDKNGLDLMKELAGYPHHSVVASKKQVHSEVTVIQRDQFGQVVGSTQRIEHTEITDLDGQWSN
jgi:hypothetical protein